MIVVSVVVGMLVGNLVTLFAYNNEIKLGKAILSKVDGAYETIEGLLKKIEKVF